MSGSSPHVRGTVIPSSPPSQAMSVHPRTCGEQDRFDGITSEPHGSSPHVRGTALLLQGNIMRIRFIPARAGNRLFPEGVDNEKPVHPRTCGEQGLTTEPLV